MVTSEPYSTAASMFLFLPPARPCPPANHCPVLSSTITRVTSLWEALVFTLDSQGPRFPGPSVQQSFVSYGQAISGLPYSGRELFHSGFPCQIWEYYLHVTRHDL